MGKEQLAKTEEQEEIQNELQSEETRQQPKRRTGGVGACEESREVTSKCEPSLGDVIPLLFFLLQLIT